MLVGTSIAEAILLFDEQLQSTNESEQAAYYHQQNKNAATAATFRNSFSTTTFAGNTDFNSYGRQQRQQSAVPSTRSCFNTMQSFPVSSFADADADAISVTSTLQQ
jgi:hypothetical protein